MVLCGRLGHALAKLHVCDKPLNEIGGKPSIHEFEVDQCLE